jgi:hypothetical protein
LDTTANENGGTGSICLFAHLLICPFSKEVFFMQTLLTNGTTGAAGDEAAIQQRIDALDAQGGVAQLEARTITLRRALVLRDGVTLQGAGPDRTALRLADGANPVEVEGRIPFVNRCLIRNENYDELATPQGNHDLTIRDLTLDGNAAQNRFCGEGILLANCYNYRIENVHVRNCRGFAGIYTNPCHAAAREKVRYQNYIVCCLVEDQQPATDRDAPYGHGFYITAPDNDNVLLKGNIARRNHGAGIHGEDFISHFFVEENEAYENGGPGIWFCEVRNSVVKRNRLHHNKGDGLHLSQGQGNRHNLISENDIHHNGNHGLSVLRQYDPGDSFCCIVSNRIWNNQQVGIVLANSAARNTVAFNFCYDDRKPPQQRIGIKADSTDNQIINNYVGSSMVAGIQAVKGNIIIEWEAKIPLTPANLV